MMQISDNADGASGETESLLGERSDETGSLLSDGCGEIESLLDDGSAETDFELSKGSDLFLLDGQCGLCNRLAQFMISRLREPTSLMFLPIESNRGQRIFSGLTLKQQSIDSVYLFRKGRVYIRSAAVLRGLYHLSWWWAMWAPIIWLIPLPLRDLGYRIVAKYRRRLFKDEPIYTF